MRLSFSSACISRPTLPADLGPRQWAAHDKPHLLAAVRGAPPRMAAGSLWHNILRWCKASRCSPPLMCCVPQPLLLLALLSICVVCTWLTRGKLRARRPAGGGLSAVCSEVRSRPWTGGCGHRGRWQRSAPAGAPLQAGEASKHRDVCKFSPSLQSNMYAMPGWKGPVNAGPCVACRCRL